MDLTGSRHLNAPRETVWAMLNDPEVLARCIPGCQSLEKLSDTEMKGIVGVKIGPVSAKFTGDVTLSDIDAPNSYRISGSGKAGAVGTASGGAAVTLSDADGGTTLDYTVEAKVTGKLAQVGGRLIDAAATKLAGQFFDALEAEFPAPDQAAVAEQAPEADDTETDAPATNATEADDTAPTASPVDAQPQPIPIPEPGGPTPKWMWAALGVTVLIGIYAFMRAGAG